LPVLLPAATAPSASRPPAATAATSRDPPPALPWPDAPPSTSVQSRRSAPLHSAPMPASATPAACAARWAGPAADAPVPRPRRPDTVARCACSGGSTPPISSDACTSVSSCSLTPARIVNRSRSFRLIFNVSMLWPGWLPQPRPKGDISIELSWGHSHGVPTTPFAQLNLPRASGIFFQL